MRGKQQSYEAFCDQIASSPGGLVVASSQRCGTHLLGAYLHDCGVRAGKRFLPMLTAYRQGALSDEAFAALLDGIKDGPPGFSICLMDYFPTVLDIFRDEGCDPMRFITALKTLPWSVAAPQAFRCCGVTLLRTHIESVGGSAGSRSAALRFCGDQEMVAALSYGSPILGAVFRSAWHLADRALVCNSWPR